MPVVPPGPSGSQPRIRLDNVENRETVHQRLLIVQGFIEGSRSPRDTLLVQPSPAYDAVVWQVNHGHFKALVPLAPGPNELVFKLYGGSFGHVSQLEAQSAVAELPVSIWYQRDRGALPVQLAILVGRDSPAIVPTKRTTAPSAPQQTQQPSGGLGSKLGHFSKKVSSMLGADEMRAGTTVHDPDRALVDSPRGAHREQLRDLEEIKRRMALQAYLWQAFHAEQMRRMGLGRRTFALDDARFDDQPGKRDISTLPKIHVLVSNRTVQEIRDPENAQQKRNARNGGAQHQFAGECLRDPRCPPEIQANRAAPLAILTLDTMWDPRMQLLRGHAAVGSASVGDTSYGVMGSHWLWAAPSSLNQVTACFQNTEQTDTSCCVNDLNECKYAFETLNIGSGAFMHELGHALNNPHWPSGLMARGYTEFNRAFMTAEGPRCRGSGNVNPITPDMDSVTNHIHRAQGVRARWHPSFVLPSDPPHPYLDSRDPAAWREWSLAEPTWEPTKDGARIYSQCGIGALEIEINDVWRTSIEFTALPPGGEAPPQEFMLTRDRLQAAPHVNVNGRISINVLACNMRQTKIHDFYAQAYAQAIQLQGVPFPITKGMHVGVPDASQQHFTHVFRHTYEPNVQLTAIVIHAGAALDGFTLLYSDGRNVVLGGTGGSPRRIDIRPGDSIARMEVRSGAWLDAVDIVLTSGARSGLHGGSGGGARVLNVGQGQTVVGIYGSSNQWLHSLGLVLA